MKKKSIILLPRNELYNLEPIGIGTPYIESLNSYIGRLARSHYLKINDFINYFLIEKFCCLDFQYNPRSFMNSYTRSSSFGNFTDELIKVLEILTSRNDLESLTMTKWSGIFHRKEIFHQRLRWCPKCLIEQQANQKEIYEPLLWSIKQAEFCSIHKILLSYECPCCKKMPRRISANYVPGYCTYCGCWLGYEDNLPSDLNQDQIQEKLFFTSEFEKLISKNDLPVFPLNILEIRQEVINIIKISSKGNFRYFSKITTLDRNSVMKWVNKKTLPSINSLLKVCNTFNISLVDLVLNNCNYSEIKVNTKLNKRNISTVEISSSKSIYSDKTEEFKGSIKVQIDNIISNEYPPPPLTVVRKKLKYHHFDRAFPIEAKIIDHNYKEYKLRKVKENEEELIEFCNKLRAIIKNLHKEGKNLSVGEIRKLIKKPGRLRNPAVRAAIEEARIEFEYK